MDNLYLTVVCDINNQRVCCKMLISGHGDIYRGDRDRSWRVICSVTIMQYLVLSPLSDWPLHYVGNKTQKYPLHSTPLCLSTYLYFPANYRLNRNPPFVGWCWPWAHTMMTEMNKTDPEKVGPTPTLRSATWSPWKLGHNLERNKE